MGALAAVALDALVPRTTAIIAALVAVAIALAAHYRLGFGRFVYALEGVTPIFPRRERQALGSQTARPVRCWLRAESNGIALERTEEEA